MSPVEVAPDARAPGSIPQGGERGHTGDRHDRADEGQDLLIHTLRHLQEQHVSRLLDDSEGGSSDELAQVRRERGRREPVPAPTQYERGHIETRHPLGQVHGLGGLHIAPNGLRSAGAELPHPETHRTGGGPGREQELLGHREKDDLANGPGQIGQESFSLAIDRRKFRAAREEDETSHRVGSADRELDGDGTAQRVSRGEDRASIKRVEQPGGDLPVHPDVHVWHRIGLAVSWQVEGHDPQYAFQASELVDPVACTDPRTVEQKQRRGGRRVPGRQIRHAASVELHEPASDPRFVDHVQAWSSASRRASDESESAAMTRSAVARFVASGTLWTFSTRSNARISGSCGCADSGSTKKITASTDPVATRAAICASPPSGPLSTSSTSSPTFSRTSRAVCRVATSWNRASVSR